MVTKVTRGGPHVVDLHVGRRVRARRKAVGLTLEALAGDLQITYQQLQKYETGANRISVSMLYDIARALQMPVEQFYGGLPPVLVSDGEQPASASGIDDVLTLPGGGDLLEAFLAMPRSLRDPLVAIARGVAELEKRPRPIKARSLPTWR